MVRLRRRRCACGRVLATAAVFRHGRGKARQAGRLQAAAALVLGLGSGAGAQGPSAYLVRLTCHFFGLLCCFVAARQGKLSGRGLQLGLSSVMRSCRCCSGSRRAVLVRVQPASCMVWTWIDAAAAIGCWLTARMLTGIHRGVQYACMMGVSI
jgi:hypothetical protein